ncbi:Methionine--tRNA ligase, cytoplasmic [Manis javanica]|nr:Methionine--tRNA ligase, cytoplasmic [Manis javanica]
MIAAEKAGKTPQQFVADIAAGPMTVPGRLPHRLRQLAQHRRARKPRAGPADLQGPEGCRLHRDAHHRAVLRHREEHVPARPLHQGRMPALPAKDQYGGNCGVCSAVYAPTDLINPSLGAVRRKPVLKSSEHFFLTVGPALRGFP